jgi:hypothetical protein
VAEGGQLAVFLRILLLAEQRVVAILLAALRVVADRLDMAVRIGAEPGALISGRQTDGV